MASGDIQSRASLSLTAPDSMNGHDCHSLAETLDIHANSPPEGERDRARLSRDDNAKILVDAAQAQNRATELPATSSVDLVDFLLPALQSTFSAEARLRLIHHPSTSNCFVSLEQARHIACLTHEVVANAIEHAHPSGINVEVTLECHRSADGRQVVAISDDGVGLPESMDPYVDGGSGFKKIRTLAGTMGAELRIESDSLGSTFALALPANAQRDVAQSDAYFRKILDELPMAVYATNMDGRVAYFNEAAAVLWGCRPEIGSTKWSGARKVFWPDGREMPLAESPIALAIREKRQIRGMETIVERPDGTRTRCLPIGRVSAARMRSAIATTSSFGAS